MEKELSKIRCKELWSLDHTLAKYILPRLIKFKEINTMSYPVDFKNNAEWHKVIDKMVYSFEYVINNNFTNYEEEKQKQARYQEGMNLFAEHFMDLWD